MEKAHPKDVRKNSANLNAATVKIQTSIPASTPALVIEHVRKTSVCKAVIIKSALMSASARISVQWVI